MSIGCSCLKPQSHTPLFAITAVPLQLYHCPREKILAFNHLTIKDLSIFGHFASSDFEIGFKFSREYQFKGHTIILWNQKDWKECCRIFTLLNPFPV